MTKRMPRGVVKSSEFKTFEVGYGVHKGLIKGWASSSNSAITATNVEFSITDSTGNVNAVDFLRIGDVINITDNQTGQSNGSASLMGENLEITAVSGKVITAIRGGDIDDTGTRITANSAKELFFTIQAPARHEGSSVGDAKTYASEGELNYTQIVEFPWAVTGTEQAEEHYATSNPMAEEARKARMNAMRYLERTAFFGERKARFVGSKRKRYTGGAAWFIGGYVHYDNANPQSYTSWSTTADMVTGTAAALSQVWKVGDVQSSDNWSIDKFYQYSSKNFAYGSTTKWLFAGSGFMQAHQRLFREYLRLSQNDSIYSFEVLSMRTSFGTYKIVYDPELDDSQRGNDAFCIDLPNMNFVHLRGRDLEVQKNVQAKGDDELKDRLFGEIGFKINFHLSHSWITGLTNI